MTHRTSVDRYGSSVHGDRWGTQPPSFTPSDPVQRAASLVHATAVRPASWGELAVALVCLGMTPDARTLERVRQALETF